MAFSKSSHTGDLKIGTYVAGSWSVYLQKSVKGSFIVYFLGPKILISVSFVSGKPTNQL